MHNHLSTIKKLYCFTKGCRIIFWISVLTSPLQWIIAIFSSSLGFEKMMEALQILNVIDFIQGFLFYTVGLLISCIIRGLSVYSQKVSTVKIQNNIRYELLNCSLRQKNNNIKLHSGELMSINDQDSEAVSKILTVYLIDIITPILVSTVCLTAIAVQNLIIAFVLFFTMIIVFILHRKFEPLYFNTGLKIKNSLAKLCSTLEDNLTGAFVIRTLSLQNYIKNKTNDASKEFYNNSISEIKLKTKHMAAVSFWFQSSTTIPFVLSAIFIIYKKISFGNIVYISQLSNSLISFSDTLATTIALYQQSMASVKRIYSVLDTDLESEKTENTDIIFSEKEDILLSLKNIYAFYNNNTVLKGINIDIPKNKTIAIIGESGAGKSTLAKVLLSFVNYTGEIRWKNKKIDTDIAITLLRKNIAYIPQNPAFFEMSILENILLGHKNATKEDAVTAAQKIGADKFINKLPNKYDTLVGERDLKLSGGECQKISFSRAILKDAPIILMDEATSALDTQSSNDIEKFLSSIKHKCTVIMITHDIRYAKNADLIYIMKEGNIIEKGRHDQLMKTSNEYKKFLAVK